MKKLISFVLTAMCMTLMNGITASSADKIIYGDVNGDGLVNSSDASAILGYYAEISVGNEPAMDKNFTIAGDINDDGKVDSADSSNVLEFYAYVSTTKDNEISDIREYLGFTDKKPTAQATKPASTTATTKSTTTKATAVIPETMTIKTEVAGSSTTGEMSTTPPVTTEIVNIVLAPEGLDPGKEGSIEYIINTAKLTPHDEIPLYNIKGDNQNGGKPYLVRNYYLTDKTKIILNDFAREHFTDEMTNYDRLKFTWNWLHYNVDYASSWEAYSQISELSWSEASFVKKSGQCIQYNGAFAEMMAYMGYDVYMLEKWNRPNFTVQHFMSEVMIDGKGYNTEVGERSYDSGSYKWMWLFDPNRQEFFGIEEQPEAEVTGEK